MSPFPFSRACFLGVVSLALSVSGWASDVDQRLEDLRKKVAEKEAALAKGSSYPSEARISSQISRLQSIIRSGQYEGILDNLNQLSYGVPAEYQNELQQLLIDLREDLETRRQAEEEKRRTAIDALVSETRKACLEAKTSSDLDTLLIRCAGLQAKRERENTVLSQRLSEKLNGCASTLEQLSKYWDFRDAGNNKRANEMLRSLAEANSGFPVLKANEIDALYLPVVSDENNPRASFAILAADLKSPADLPALKQKIEAFVANPRNSQTGSNLRMEINRIESLQKVSDLIAKSDYASALTSLSRWNSSGMTETMDYYAPIREQLQDQITSNMMLKWTTLKPSPNEEVQAYVERVIDDLSAKGDYAKIVEVSSFADLIRRSKPDPNGAVVTNAGADRASIERFLAAQRFEAAGDFLAAMTNYRSVVGSSAPHAPIKPAEEALKRLIEKYPDLAKNNDGVVLEELKAVRAELRMFMNRTGAGGPPRPYPY